MSYILIIVESPGKIQKISHILGNDYKVCASVGHVMDLDETELSIDIKNNYEPKYVINKDKISVIKNIKDLYKKADDVYFGGDMDREGQMINWSLSRILEIEKPKIIKFNSITKMEITNAVKNPQNLDENLVNAQKARRILDRIIGYTLSNPLSKQLRTKASAGRVMSVVVKLIIDKEKEIREKIEKIKSNYMFEATFISDEKTFESKLYMKKKNELVKMNEENAVILFDKLIDYKYIVKDIEFSESKSNPSPPFTTSSLLQEAKKKFGFTSKLTMMTAQNLYENGKITYMRTDSVSISKDALFEIKNYIIDKYGEKYYRYCNYESKKHNTQEAHEAIRVTNVKNEIIDNNKKIGTNEIKLYNLIWKRTVASQMQPIVYKIMKINIIPIMDKKGEELFEYVFISEQKEVLFIGYMILYDCKKESIIIEIKKNEILKLVDLECQEKYENIPSRYDEASLINELDPNNLNIGRPSTYSTIINKIQNVKYVEKKSNDGQIKNIKNYKWNIERGKKCENKETTIGKDIDKFVPTDIGYIITDTLVRYFPEIMEYKFTANMENDLDKIASGELVWYNVVDIFYKLFIKQFDIFVKIDNKTERKINDNIYIILINKKPVIKYINEDKSILFVDIEEPYNYNNIDINNAIKLIEKNKLYPKKIGSYNDVDIMIKKGKFGYYLQYNNTNISIKSPEINLDDAKKLIDEKKIHVLGKYENDDVILRNGRYGYYIMYKNKNYSVKNEKNINKITDLTLDNAIQIINDNKTIKFKDKNKEYCVKNGNYGYYIQIIEMKKKTNVKIPKDIDIENITLEQINDIIFLNSQKINPQKTKKEKIEKKIDGTEKFKEKMEKKIDGTEKFKEKTEKKIDGTEKFKEKTEKKKVKEKITKGSELLDKTLANINNFY